MQGEISIEQEFQIAAFRTTVEALTLEEAKDLLVHLFEAKVYMESIYRGMLREQWQV